MSRQRAYCDLFRVPVRDQFRCEPWPARGRGLVRAACRANANRPDNVVVAWKDVVYRGAFSVPANMVVSCARYLRMVFAMRRCGGKTMRNFSPCRTCLSTVWASFRHAGSGTALFELSLGRSGISLGLG